MKNYLILKAKKNKDKLEIKILLVYANYYTLI